MEAPMSARTITIPRSVHLRARHLRTKPKKIGHFVTASTPQPGWHNPIDALLPETPDKTEFREAGPPNQPSAQFLTERELAKRWGLSVRTIQAARYANRAATTSRSAGRFVTA